jgi:hypothetical protein
LLRVVRVVRVVRVRVVFSGLFVVVRVRVFLRNVKKTEKNNKRQRGAIGLDSSPAPPCAKKRPAAAQAAHSPPPKKKAKGVKGAASPQKPAALSFPGVPKSNPGALLIHGVKVYTSLASKKWRCLPVGWRVDTPFSWATNPKAAWQGVVQFVADYKAGKLTPK